MQSRIIGILCLVLTLGGLAGRAAASELIVLPESGREVTIDGMFGARSGWQGVLIILVEAHCRAEASVTETEDAADELFEYLMMYVGTDEGASGVMIKMLPAGHGGGGPVDAYISTYIRHEADLWRLDGRSPRWNDRDYQTADALTLEGYDGLRQERALLGHVQMDDSARSAAILMVDLNFAQPGFDLADGSQALLNQAWLAHYRARTEAQNAVGTQLRLHDRPRRARFHVRSFAMLQRILPPEIDLKIETEPVTLAYFPAGDGGTGFAAYTSGFGQGNLAEGPLTTYSLKDLNADWRQAVAAQLWKMGGSQTHLRGP